MASVSHFTPPLDFPLDLPFLPPALEELGDGAVDPVEEALPEPFEMGAAGR